MIKILQFAILFVLITSMDAFATKGPSSKATSFYLYVGSYTESEKEGIYIYKFDAVNGDVKYVATQAGVKNPSYLAIDEKHNLLVAVNETADFNPEKSGSLTSFRIDLNSGKLRKINEVASGGGAPCYISIHKSGSPALVANYTGGNIVTVPIAENGTLLNYSDVRQHVGSGPAKGRQDHPHAHSIVFDPKNNFAIGVDLGIDKLITYDVKNGEMLSEKNSYSVAPGAGPRHMAFHPNKRFAYVISELNSTISALSYDSKVGSFAEIGTISTLPSDFDGTSYCADIHVSPNGKFLYGSNRGHNSIAVFSIDSKTGDLSLVDHTSVKGDWPRNFMIDPTGQFLLVANQRSNNIVVFKIDPETGRLRSNGVEISVSKPVCLKMLAIQ